jgi:hypothetical protein
MTTVGAGRSTHTRWTDSRLGIPEYGPAPVGGSQTGARLDPTLNHSTRVGVTVTQFLPTSPVSDVTQKRRKEMKMSYVTTLAIAAGFAAAIGLAPIAAADASVHQSPGNAEVVATPGQAAQEAAQNEQPFGGDSGALLFHHGRG